MAACLIADKIAGDFAASRAQWKHEKAAKSPAIYRDNIRAIYKTYKFW
jgi:hypothetical protein